MLQLLFRALASLLHAGLIFGLAPLLLGVVTRMRARLLGQCGPTLLQPYRDLWKLLQKTPLIPDNATGLYKTWPFVSIAALGAAALLVPGFALDLLSARLSDLITLIGLFALAQAALLLAGLETGFGFGGAGAGRDVLFGIFSQAALLAVILIFALIAGDPTVDGIAGYFRVGQIGVSVPLGLALAAMLAVALTDITDHPAGEQELGMVRQALLLEYSGRYLALFTYAAGLRLMIWCSLIATIFCPFGMAQAGNILSWPLGLVTWLGKLGALAAGLALFQVGTAKMRVFRVPERLGMALLLGVVATVFLFAGRPGE